MGIRTADVSVQRHAARLCRSSGYGERHAQHRIGPEVTFRGRTVQLQHQLVQLALVIHVASMQHGSYALVDVHHRLRHSLAAVATLVAIAQLQRFILTRRSPRRHGSTSYHTILKHHVGLNGRRAARVQDLTSSDIRYSHIFVSYGLYFNTNTMIATNERNIKFAASVYLSYLLQS